MKRLLILGGTADARALAAAVAETLAGRAEAVTSWAGRTGRAPDVAGETRVGGFGGSAGMVDYIQRETIDMVIDATHPFAETISDHAYDAALIAQVPRLGLIRPPWRLPPGSRWVEVANLEAAAEALGKFAHRVFLTSGRQTIDAFADVADVWFLVRLIDPPAESLPLAAYEVTTGRPPFTLEHEKALIADHNIDTLVSKSSGGPLPAKISAAVEMGLPMVLIAPPPPVPGARAESVAAALEWIERQL